MEPPVELDDLSDVLLAHSVIEGARLKGDLTHDFGDGVAWLMEQMTPEERRAVALRVATKAQAEAS